MTEQMKTVCVGRFLVDVPVHADIGLSHEMIDGFRIDTVEESEVAFRARVAAREAEIGSEPGPPGQQMPGRMVEARDLRVAHLVGRLFVHGRTRSYSMEGSRRIDDEWVTVEAHAHLQGLTFTLSMEYANPSDANDAEALIARLRLRDPDEIPATPGFCIRRALFAEPLPPHKTEHVVMHLGLPGHPDMGLALSSMPSGSTAGSLLERVAQTDAQGSADDLLRVTKLRSGKRSINGIEGEEVLERVRELNFTTGYGFMWEASGKQDDPSRPYLMLNMETGTNPQPGGRPVDSSLHEDAVVALWDRISSTIRLRPSGPPPGAAEPPEPPAPKLGTLATAGDVCPQSGWWKCREGGPGADVQGGAIQWIRKGDRMPQALLLPRQTLWQKLRGLQPSIEPEQATTWKLVDKRLRPRTPTLVTLAQPGPVGAHVDFSSEGEPSIAVGSHVKTGETCPVSGWWRCAESHALDGTRWFPRGSTLPAATFQVPSGMFGRVSGTEVIQRRSSWQLARRADAEGVALLAVTGQEQQADGNARPAGSSKLA